jgi:hypothetical protein
LGLIFCLGASSAKANSLESTFTSDPTNLVDYTISAPTVSATLPFTLDLSFSLGSTLYGTVPVTFPVKANLNDTYPTGVSENGFRPFVGFSSTFSINDEEAFNSPVDTIITLGGNPNLPQGGDPFYVLGANGTDGFELTFTSVPSPPGTGTTTSPEPSIAISSTVAPEPNSLMLMLLGIGILALIRKHALA